MEIKNKPTIIFKATLSKSITSKLFISLSKKVKIPSENKIMVEGVINSFPFITNLEENKLILNKLMKEKIKAKVGEEINLELTQIGKEETRIPMDFSKALKTNQKAQATWQDTTPLARRDWIFWIITAKQSETRKTRIKNACDMLSHGKRRVCCFPGVKWLMKNNKY